MHFVVRRFSTVKTSDDIGVVTKQNLGRRLRRRMNDGKSYWRNHYFAAVARLASTFEIPN